MGQKLGEWAGQMNDEVTILREQIRVLNEAMAMLLKADPVVWPPGLRERTRSLLFRTGAEIVNGGKETEISTTPTNGNISVG